MFAKANKLDNMRGAVSCRLKAGRTTALKKGISRQRNSVSSADREREKLQNRADILFPNTVEKKAGMSIDTSETIAGVSRGEPMTYEQAGGKNVNPEFTIIGNGNTTYKENCQSCVAVFEARMRGYNVETKLPKTDEDVKIKDELELRPNLAYIDPKTNSIPEFTILEKATDGNSCAAELDKKINPNERYLFAFDFKNNNSKSIFAHVLIVMKDKNNNLKFYDPQCGIERNSDYLSNVKFRFGFDEEGTKPKILRVDDKKLNYKILNSISQESGAKSKNHQ